MSNELVVQADFANQLVELDKIQDSCKKLLQTKHYQSLGEAGIHGIIARAKALGIHPFEALNGMFYNVNGKIGMSTETMAALVRKRGHSITKDTKSNNECCILHGKRADTGDTWTCTFTKQDAEAAGLWNGPTWKKYPGIMLYNRCMSMLFRQLFPDLSIGAGYVEDELKEIAKVDEYKLPVTEWEIVQPKPSIEPQRDYIEPLKENNVPSPNFNEMVDNLRKILNDCGKDYEMKILEHYEISHISQIPIDVFPVVIRKALSFREMKIKEQDSQG